MEMKTSEASSMEEHMQEMTSLMGRIKTEQDPAVREKLMQKHMEAMEEGMQMMTHGTNKGSDMNSMSMEKRMGMMSERMHMMEMMMEQMMGQMRSSQDMQQPQSQGMSGGDM